MAIWLTKDSAGLCLFTGENPPSWEGGDSVTNDDFDSEFLGTITTKEANGIRIEDGQCHRVELRAVASKPTPVTDEMHQLTEATGVATD